MNNQLTIGHSAESTKQAIIKALNSPKIIDSDFKEFAVAVSAAIEQAVFYLGLNKTDEDRDMLKMAAVNDCQTTFKLLTIAEVALALQNGVRGQYGEVRGMAPKDIYYWLNSYQLDSIRLACKKELAAKQEVSSEPSDEEILEIQTYNINKAWNDFKRDGYFHDHGNVIYNILDRNKKITFSAEEKKQFMHVAKSQLLKTHDPNKHIGDDLKMKEVMKIAESIRADENNIRIIAEAKRLAVDKFFQNLVDNNIELWDLFK